MSDNDFYQEQNWYNTGTYQPDELLSAPVQSAKKPKNKKKRNYRIAGAICVLLVLIVATSLAFGGDREGIVISDKPAQSGDGFSGGFSDDFEEFFKNYYTGVDLQRTDINIPRADLPDYAMELQTHEREEMSLKELYERCAPSVVAISGYKDGQNGYNWGTGVVLSEDGLILTNTHVIDGCDSAKVTLSDDRELDAKLVGADGISDLAVLKIEAEGLTPAEFGESGSLQVGESVAAIGNPLGETFRSTLTDGIISAIERGISYQGHSMTLLQTNTAINEGNSGGALFNMYGKVIGITNMKMMSSYSSIEGIGFAIPYWYVFGTKKELKEQHIMEGGKVMTGNFNKSYFTKVDIRNISEIKLMSKSAKLLTTHPSSSYALVRDANKQYTLRITNPQIFWSTSKYLVVLVK